MNKDRKDKDRKDKDPMQKLSRLFMQFSGTLEADAKRFNQEQQKTKDKLNNGAKLTKHRITL